MMQLWKPLAVLALAGVAMPAFAADCATEIEANDQMQFSKSSIEVPASCKQFKLTLKHTGKLPRNAMGHNWVLTTPADYGPVARDGMGASLETNFLKVDDARVVAHTKVIGGGESDTVSFDVAKLTAPEYNFFCSFPGHAMMMKGSLKLVK
ncbi:azurin [Hydrocarboniphaga effusa]|uniref:Azurin n=1 Tax=Hydrocarboniphaga effusa AP103 TaxID=1172194 RepID=I7ZG07_9GAMM|nr:azurin [Hydrocarboniphaga effusa AP103]